MVGGIYPGTLISRRADGELNMRPFSCGKKNATEYEYIAIERGRLSSGVRIPVVTKPMDVFSE
jgi:hypothetical protein